MKQIVSHNGKKSCGKCEVTGEHLGRMCYSKFRNKTRTDSEFRLRLDKVHHNDPTLLDPHNGSELTSRGPLEEIDRVDMIDSFAIDS